MVIFRGKTATKSPTVAGRIKDETTISWRGPNQGLPRRATRTDRIGFAAAYRSNMVLFSFSPIDFSEILLATWQAQMCGPVREVGEKKLESLTSDASRKPEDGMHVEEITNVLSQAARLGAEVCVNERRTCTLSIKPPELDSPPHVALALQVVTSADLVVQEVILQHLLSHGLGRCALRAEEDTALVHKFVPSPGAPTIYVDPIDGTLAYCIGCDGWEGVATRAGFSDLVVQLTKARTDPRLYGIVLGASYPDSTVASVCCLPELGLFFQAVNGRAFLNDDPLGFDVKARPIRVAIGRRLLDAAGEGARHFTNAAMDVFWFCSSSPAVLYHLFEGNCTAYAGIDCAFDMQLATVIAQSGGLYAAARDGSPFAPDLLHHVPGIVIASSAEAAARIAAVMQYYD
jgi:fructose-1,6-bisphosphatase/inositol monophosphatase family enzyme